MANMNLDIAEYKKQQDDLLANGGAAFKKGKIVTQVDLTFKSIKSK